MTTGIAQHHVAVVLLRSRCTGGVSSLGRCAHAKAPQHQICRLQSSAAKSISRANDSRPGFGEERRKSEIPFGCFVESSAVPQPSLGENPTVVNIDLNSTRPAALDSPSQPERRDYPDGAIPLTDRVKYLFKLGKSFLLFYKTGLKNVWSNSKQYRTIKGRLQGLALNTVAKYAGQSVNGQTVPEISHTEYQLCVRTRHDIFKMVPFSLVFIICGEFTPLVIIALGSSVVPYTCRIPRQEQKDLEKKLQKDRQYMEDLPKLHPELETPAETSDWRVEHLEAYRLGLTSMRTPIPAIGQLYHTLITRPRLVRHCDNIVSHTLLIHRQGGASKLSRQDLYEWGDAYGLYALRQYIEKCQSAGQDPRTERLKTELLPKIEGEIRYMLEQVTAWAQLKPTEQWRIGLRTVGSQSPDWKARASDMRRQWKQA